MEMLKRVQFVVSRHYLSDILLHNHNIPHKTQK